MARGVNKVILIGNIGNIDSRSTQGGDAICNLSIATSESWKDKQSGQMQDRTEWHKVSMFGRLAEIANQHLHVGSKVYIEGSLQTRKWQDKDGKDCYTTEIKAKELEMLGGGDSAPRAPQQAAQPQAKASEPEFDDTDLPF